jgi:hypothetical protein
MIGNVLQDTAFRRQDPPQHTAAAALYDNTVAREYKDAHHITHAANKASEVNAFNIPYTPAMVVRVYPTMKHSLQTFRLMSRPIKLLTGAGSGNV